MEKIEVFISYAHEDSEIAFRVYNKLSEAGVVAWIDKECLKVGQRLDIEIPKVINQCSFFLAIFSSTAVIKRGYVQKEFKLALEVVAKLPSEQIFVLPVRVDECEVPFAFQNLHWVDLFPYLDNGIEEILKVIKNGKHTQKPLLTKENTIKTIKELFIETISGSINYLIAKRDKKGHWGDVRSTTLALWALNEIIKYTDISKEEYDILNDKKKLANKWLSSRTSISFH